MCAFVVSYSAMSVCLEEERNAGFAHRRLKEELGKPNLTEGEIWRMAKTASQKGSQRHLWSQDPFGSDAKVTT